MAKDGTVWSSTPPASRRIMRHNIFSSPAIGATKKTQGQSIIDTFKLLMTNEMRDIIIRETNRKAKDFYLKYNEAIKIMGSIS